jgi:hypothetical protein
VTQTLDERRVAVSVDELKRAWTAIQSGRFRIGAGETSDPRELAPLPASKVWEPGPGERVLLVIGCAGSSGASTIALALASAAAAPARVVECSSVTASGLAAASTAELGPHESGWTRGTRDGVLPVDRADGPGRRMGDRAGPDCPSVAGRASPHRRPRRPGHPRHRARHAAP